MSGDENQDLPLLSLKSDFIVEHYIMNLNCQLDNKCFSGQVYAFVKQCGPGSTLILDIKDLVVEKVEELEADSDEILAFLNSFDQRKSHERFQFWTSKKPKHVLNTIIEDWCVKIEGFQRKESIVCYQYHTKPEGSSLSWFNDDDGNPCCLTTGSLVNNRSLLPYQDAPSLMATWQLIIQVPDSYSVVTTGDDTGLETDAGTYFYTSMVLPMSTFALAIGKWRCIQISFPSESVTSDDRVIECRHPYYPCPFAKTDISYPKIPCRVFHSESNDPSLLKNYIPDSIEEMCRILGRHVVPKMDFIIIPQSVACLGFASPGLILISPSILYGRAPMLARLGHEISHSWFGINIGPKNWNEEWISEGFATFMEDVIELKMSKFSHRGELMALKAFNRYQILKSDCHNVDSALQCVSTTEQSQEIVVNGLNRDKIVSQIPYLKGYFFLVQIANVVGLDSLLLSLKCYVEHFHGCLVTTAECVDFFCRQFQRREEIIHQAKIWLYGSSLPDDLSNLFILNRLDIEVAQHAQYWKRPSPSPPVFIFPQAMPDQVLALLDRLLELEGRLPTQTVVNFIEHYQPHLINADVYHRACEWIVAQKCARFLPIVKQFLLQHPAMGAYLYGELALSNRPQFQTVATEAFHHLEDKLDTNFKAIIKDLIFN